MSAIIVEKHVVVKAIDQLTEPLARMNQTMDNFMQKANEISTRLSQSSQGMESFRTALTNTKVSAQEAAEGTDKLQRSVSRLKGKDIKVDAKTDSAKSGINSVGDAAKSLPDNKAIDIKADTDNAGKHIHDVAEKIDRIPEEKITDTKVDDEATPKIDNVKRHLNSIGDKTITPKVDDTPANNAIDRVKSHLQSAGEAGSSMTKSFVIGNLIANGLTWLGNEAKNIAVNGLQAAIAGQKMAQGWRDVGMSESQVKSVGNSVKEIKENSDLSGQAVGQMITRFYGLTGSAKQAQTLAFGVATLTDHLHLSGEAADTFTTSLVRIESSGKVTSQSLGRMERVAPGLGKALQEASGMSRKSFSDLVNSGKMTSSQFNDILSRASKNWKATSSDWDKTVDGQMHHLQAQWQDTQKALMAPLVTTASAGLASLSKSMTALDPLVKQIGQGIGNLAQKMADWLTPQHVTDLGKILSALATMAGVIGKAVWKTFAGIINLITAPFRILSTHVGKSSDGLTNFANGLEAISKNKMAMTVLSGIAALLTTQLAYGKLFNIAKGLFGVSDGLLSIEKIKLSGHLLSDLKNSLGNFSIFSKFTANASAAGDEAGTGLLSKMTGKLSASRLAVLGEGIGSKLAVGAQAAFGAVDILRGLTGTHIKNRAQMVGKGFGTIAGTFAGMALTPVLGPFGPILGGMLGRAIGGGIGKHIKGLTSFLDDIFVKHDWHKAFAGVTEGLKHAYTDFKNWWNGDDQKSSSSKKSSSEPSSHEIKSLGGNHYSKADIANVKAMNAAIKAYTSSLKKLKDAIKHNDPTKELNAMNKRLSRIIKSWDKLAKPIDKISKSFTNFKRAIHSMSDSIKQLTGKHGLSEFDKGLKKVEQDMRHSKLGDEFSKLSKSIKKSNFVKEVRQMSTAFKNLYKSLSNMKKPLMENERRMEDLQKAAKKLTDRKSGLPALDDSIKTLDKDLVKYDFGKRLSQEMAVANKAVGRHGFTKEFSAMVRSVIGDLHSFSSNFKSEWSNLWGRLNKDAESSLDRVTDTVEKRFDDILSHEHSFIRSFNSSWKSWLSDVVSAFRSGFSKLPGIAQKAAENIVIRLNRGISGINKVIGDFGGDKRLGTISYARGTFTHPGGKAIINDGPQPDKTELIWQPSRGWQTFNGQNRAVDLEAGSMVMDASHSAPLLNRFGGLFPHYADGSLSDEEMDKLAEQFENNPTAASKSLMLKFTDWSGADIFQTLGKAEAVGFSSGISNVLKDLLGEVKEPKNGDWTPVIRSAAAKLHFHIAGWQIAKLLRQIQTESGGIETRHQEVWDKNMASGNPAQGLLQFIPSTFNTWALPGHHNIFSGFDQIMAAINALNHGGEGGWGNIGNGHGWANGGHITSLDYGFVGDNPQHSEYVINPYNDNAMPLMKQAYEEIGNARPELRNTSRSGNGEVVDLLKEVLYAVRNIRLQPVLPVDETRRMINKQNATDVRLMS